MFPLTFEFSRKLDKKIEENEFKKVLNLINKTVTDRKGNVIYIGQQKLIYKGSDSAWRQNIFKSINKGVFKVEYANMLTIKYTIYLTRIVLIGIIASMVFGIISQQFQVGIFVFIWASGLNWSIAVIRHGSMLNDIVVNINDIKSDLIQ